jgi:hypothetical protein
MNVLRFDRPVVARQARLAVDQVFYYWGRALRIAKIHGDDPAAPVIVEELGLAAGQLSLWSLDGVRRAMKGQLRSPLKEEPNAPFPFRKPARANPPNRR